jgi:hypothetical protein
MTRLLKKKKRKSAHKVDRMVLNVMYRKTFSHE